MTSLDWGDVPTWIAALSTVGALVAAIVAGRAAWRLLGLEATRDRNAFADKKTVQASRVSAWAKWERSAEGAESDYDIPLLSVRNASDLPVYAVLLELFNSRDQLVSTERVDVLPPTDGPIDLPHVVSDAEHSALQGDYGSKLQVKITFRDASGRTWVRQVDGLLYQSEPRDQ